MNVKYNYPFYKKCVICGNDFPTYNRYQAKRNKLCSPECKKKFISKLHKGKKLSEKQRKELSDKLRGRSFSEEHRRKLSLTSKHNKINLGKGLQNFIFMSKRHFNNSCVGSFYFGLDFGIEWSKMLQKLIN